MDLAGKLVNLDNPPARGVRNAVEVAVDTDHAVPAEAALQLEDRSERRERQQPQTGPFLGERFADDALGRGMHPAVGDGIEPMGQLPVQIVPDISKRPLHLTLRLSPIREQLDRLPEAARTPVSVLFDQLAETNKRIEQLTGEIEETHKQSGTSQRLATIPGVGMLSATIITATTPDVSNSGSARDYAAWLGLTPKPHSTGGKQRLGRISKMGNRYIRRLLYLGAMAQIMVRRRLGLGLDWLSSMLIRKKTKVVAIALAHRMARTIFAVLRDDIRYQPQAAA